MTGYSQPPAYHFSHDSIELADRAAGLLLPRSRGPARGLDLCAGCGVVGLELLRRLKKRRSDGSEFLSNWCVDFVEVQDVYLPHFEFNRREALTDLGGFSMERLQFLVSNYGGLVDQPSGHYDWIVSNPPYFDRDQGKLPPSDFKARCRFFLDSDFETLCRTLVHSLAPQGVALFLVRDLNDSKLARLSILDRVFANEGSWLELEPIRGTNFIQFIRNK